MMGIYQILNIKNGRKYIGSAQNVFVRWKQHLDNLRYKTHHSYKLQRDWDQYELSDFTFSILEIVNIKNNLLLREQEYIDGEPFDNLYNVASATSYKTLSIPKEFEENILYCDNMTDETKSSLKNNLVITEKVGKLAYMGNGKHDLSKTWFNKNPNEIKQLKLNIGNYYTNRTDSTAEQRAWTTFIQYYRQLCYKGNTKAFIPMNGETYKEDKRNYLCFAANCFPNGFLKRQYEDAFTIDDDIYALSILLKWIVDVSDIKKTIHIYLPSKRMEALLKQWIKEKQ